MAKNPTAPVSSSSPPATADAEIFAHQPPRITILADHAAQARSSEEHSDTTAYRADRDLLALESRLSSTFDILRHKNTRCPLALAVYGDWGTGKTSAMRWLETQLKEWNSSRSQNRGPHPRAYPIWFDPWRYHSREDVWRGIIAEVILGLFSVAQLNQQNFLPRMVEAAKKFGGFLGRSFLHALANLEFSAKGKAKISDLAEGELDFKASGEMFREIWDEYQKSSQPQKAYLNQFEDTLRTWVSGYLHELSFEEKAPARLVIFIDDLDRCLPAVALEVLEALKLYLNIPQLIFVVGLDHEVVKAVVAKHYNDQGVSPEKASSYLHKLFQLELRIPPSETQMREYMRLQIEALNEATGHYWQQTLDRSGHRSVLESALIRASRQNPREVKRLLNSALIYGRNAALDVKLRKQDPGEDNEAQRFAQGIQVLILQRVLGDELVNTHQILSLERKLEWLAMISRFICYFIKESGWDIETLEQAFRLLKEKEAESQKQAVSEVAKKVVTPNQLGPGTKPLSEKLFNKFIDLYSDLIRHHHVPQNPVWLSIDFLELLQVPFSQSVAQCAPVLAQERKTSDSAASRLMQLPAAILDRLADAAGVPPEQLTPELLLGIQHLNLSNLTITDAQFRLIPRLESLISLNLSFCPQLEILPDLHGFPQLQDLVLIGCLGLRDSESLRGLEGCTALLSLNLSRCVGLRELLSLPLLPQLEILSLSECFSIRQVEDLRGLERLKGLEMLSLPKHFLSDADKIQMVQQWVGLQCKIVE